jgi:molecular chaperone DnaK (HSP70)
MKSIIGAGIAILALSSMSAAVARDERLMFPVKSAMEKGQTTKDKLDPSIPLYFGKKTPAVEKKLGEFTSNKKTNAANKSDQEACEIAFVSAAISLQERAKKEGGNAVVNIRSVYKNENVEHDTEYLCGAGTFLSGVALRGTVATLKKTAAKKK